MAPVESLSILVQGGLSQDNLVQTANNCQHWRELLPEAEIVFSISVTDVLTGQLQPDRTLENLDLVAHVSHDGLLQVALRTIVSSCDRIVLSAGGLPLPKFKKDSSQSNINLQLAGAQEGLKHVSRAYVLRTRSDLIFLDRSFLDFYFEYASASRSDVSVLKQRVMISEIFTLNPYTLERLPLHFSDWFHFGLTEDVRRLWNIAPMTLRDQLHYLVHPYATHATEAERLFNSRLATEQYLTFAALKEGYPSLRLDYHNDLSSVDLSMDILLNEFVVCDLVRCRIYIARYMHDVVDPRKDVHCIRAKDWIALIGDRTIDYEDYYRDRIKEARKTLFVRYDPGMPPVKRLVKRFNALRGNLLAGYAALLSLLAYSRL